MLTLWQISTQEDDTSVTFMGSLVARMKECVKVNIKMLQKDRTETQCPDAMTHLWPVFIMLSHWPQDSVPCWKSSAETESDCSVAVAGLSHLALGCLLALIQ